MLQLAIVNGPNLNLIGSREQHIYGSQTLEAYFQEMQQQYRDVNFTVFQSNAEGELIDFLHSCRGKMQGIILNGGAYTHTSIAIADAIAAIEIPVVEVHISNIYAREPYRRHSYTAEKCAGCITGLGLKGYALAVEYFIDKLGTKTS
jgi:3-dehydroquinate dehydratase-2